MGWAHRVTPMQTQARMGAYSLGFSLLVGLVNPGGGSSWLEVTLNHIMKKLFSCQVFLNLSDDAKEKVSVWR